MIALFWDWWDECLELWFEAYGGMKNEDISAV